MEIATSDRPFEKVYLKSRDRDVLVIALEDLPPAVKDALVRFPPATWGAMMAPLVRDRLARELVKIPIALDHVWRDSNEKNQGGGDGALLNLSDAVTDDEAAVMSDVMRKLRTTARELALTVQDVVRMARSDRAWRYMRKYFVEAWRPEQRDLPRRTLLVNQKKAGKPAGDAAGPANQERAA